MRTRKMMLAATGLVLAASNLVHADGRNTLESTWFYDGGKPIAGKALPTVTLDKGKITGTDSCNNVMGSYTLKGKRGIRFMAASTMMMCPDMTLADAFHKGMRTARNYEVRNGRLILRGKSGQRVLVLNRINK